MYKIYIQNTPLFIAATHQIPDTGITNGLNTPIAPYVGKKKLFLQYYDMLHKNKKVEAVVLHHANLDVIWTDFLDMFTMQEAAGGLVQNQDNQLLVFYRRGSWDMPKGKIDPGETPEQAAVREVQEETGIQHLDLGPFITHSYHTFEQKDRRLLKKTWWYTMKTTDTQLIPQTEEDIEEIKWVNARQWLDSGVVIYPNIREIVAKSI